jgi:RNA polymerase sigma-70 factor (ECF subfamily)
MNAKEYNQAVELYADGLYRFILKNLKKEDDAQDIVQEAFEKLWLNKDKLDVAKAKSYLFTTGYHIMIDGIRKVKRITPLEDHHDQDYYPEEYTGIKELLDKGLEQLPESQRSVILLRDYEGYAYNEIAEITGLTESQVKVYIHRARLFLKSFIEKVESYCHGN